MQNLTSTRVSDGSSLQNLAYAYDSVGNINTITDSLSGPQTQSFEYDALDRLTSSNVTGGTDGLYTKGYTYNASTGNLASKNSVNYTAYDANHKHAATSLSNGNTYGYDANGNMTSRHVFEGTEFKDYTLTYNAENQLVSVSGDATASFVYDGDGKQIKATVNGITAVYVGQHYEVKNNIVTKYYFAGATRLAARSGTDGTLRFLLADHLGSSSVTTNASGVKTASALYKAFGESRFSSGNLGTDYKFTGQREQAELGLYFYGARWYDGSLGRFTSADTMIPSTQGVQAWDRYAGMNNNPVRYNDPSGHCIGCMIIWGLTALGYLPDFQGITNTVLLTKTDSAVVAAGLSVQSQYLPSMIGGNSFGMAGVSDEQMMIYGLDGQNQMIPSVAVDAMEVRIDSVVGAYNTHCGENCSPTDRLIIAGLAQNGSEFSDGDALMGDLKDYTTGAGIAWQKYLKDRGGNPSEWHAAWRQDASGLNFGTQLMLKLYIKDLRVLLALGYQLPNQYQGADLDYIENVIQHPAQ